MKNFATGAVQTLDAVWFGSALRLLSGSCLCEVVCVAVVVVLKVCVVVVVVVWLLVSDAGSQ